MRLADHVTSNIDNNMSTAAVISDIVKTFHTTLHSGLLHKLSELEFSTNHIKLIASLLTEITFKVSAEGEFPTIKKKRKEKRQGLFKIPSLLQYFTFYINIT
jgi:hypothetical protein